MALREKVPDGVHTRRLLVIANHVTRTFRPNNTIVALSCWFVLLVAG